MYFYYNNKWPKWQFLTWPAIAWRESADGPQFTASDNIPNKFRIITNISHKISHEKSRHMIICYVN